jgi:hypothetical protein
MKARIINAPQRTALMRDLGFGLMTIIQVAATLVVGQFASYPKSRPLACRPRYARVGEISDAVGLQK